MNIYKARTNNAVQGLGFVTTAMIIGKIAAIMAPKYGIIFKRAPITPSRTAYSIPIINE